jgi:hypothetical protein
VKPINDKPHPIQEILQENANLEVRDHHYKQLLAWKWNPTRLAHEVWA